MSTTNLFVELLVIGVGAAGWLLLFAFAALGYNPEFVNRVLSTPAAIVPGVVAIYLLGIISDRLADSVLHFLRTGRKQRLFYDDEKAAFMCRGYVLTKSPFFASQYEYSRSRQRICRGWIVNFVLLAISLNTLLLLKPEAFMRVAGVGIGSAWHVSYFATSVLLLLALASWFAWEKLYHTELMRMRDQEELLREINRERPGCEPEKSKPLPGAVSAARPASRHD
jgi:hypothetical protein